MTKGKRAQQLSLVPAAGDGECMKAEECSLLLEEGYYEVEAIRRKRMRKGEAQYFIKWLGYPESENTWEPLANLQYCSNEVDLFEESLKSGGSSRKGRRSGKRPVASSPAEESVRVSVLHPATNGDGVPDQGGPANHALLSGGCTGTRRRKSGAPKRFVAEAAGTSTAAGAQDDASDLNAIYKMSIDQGFQTSETVPDSSSPISEILRVASIISTTTTINNAKEDRIIFHAKRANGSEVSVDDGYLKTMYPDLLLNFYEKHLYETSHEI